MNVLVLEPLSERCCHPAPRTAANPLMSYDGTLGTPAAQGITPPFTNLPAMCYEINGLGQAYTWNFKTGLWV